MPCRARNGSFSLRDPFLHDDSPILLNVTYAEDDSCTLYLVDYNCWPIYREVQEKEDLAKTPKLLLTRVIAVQILE